MGLANKYEEGGQKIKTFTDILDAYIENEKAWILYLAGQDSGRYYWRTDSKEAQQFYEKNAEDLWTIVEKLQPHLKSMISLKTLFLGPKGVLQNAQCILTGLEHKQLSSLVLSLCVKHDVTHWRFQYIFS